MVQPGFARAGHWCEWVIWLTRGDYMGCRRDRRRRGWSGLWGQAGPPAHGYRSWGDAYRSRLGAVTAVGGMLTAPGDTLPAQRHASRSKTRFPQFLAPPKLREVRKAQVDEVPQNTSRSLDCGKHAFEREACLKGREACLNQRGACPELRGACQTDCGDHPLNCGNRASASPPGPKRRPHPLLCLSATNPAPRPA